MISSVAPSSSLASCSSLPARIGLIRFPDTRSRLHALTKADNIALALVLIGVALPAGSGRQMAMLLMNLMPGTMVQRAVSDGVELHTLSLELNPVEQWEQLQRRVARAYGVSPTPGAGEP